MKINGHLPYELDKVGPAARALEEAGYDCGFSAELKHDPFLPLAVATQATSRLEIMTSIAVAFARNPMTLANLGHDLNAASGGRFIMGLGAQIEPHVTRRFSMPWSRPAERMREMILAMHAIWDCWHEGKPLDFRGEFYTHTLMTHYFTPDDHQYGRPKVMLAAVGPAMTRVAAEIADGMLCHIFTTPRYMHEVTIPQIEKTLAAADRDRAKFEIVASCSSPPATAKRKSPRAWRRCARRSRSTARRPPTRPCSSSKACTTCIRNSTGCRRTASGTR